MPIPKKAAAAAPVVGKTVQFDEIVKTQTKNCKLSEVYKPNIVSPPRPNNKRPSSWVADWDIVSKKRVNKANQDTLVSILPVEQATTPPKKARGWHYKRKIASQSLGSPPLKKKDTNLQDFSKALTRAKSVPVTATVVSPPRSLRSAKFVNNIKSGKKQTSLSPRCDKKTRFGRPGHKSPPVTTPETDDKMVKRYPVRATRPNAAAQRKHDDDDDAEEDEFGGVSEFTHFNSKIKSVIEEDGDEDEFYQQGDIEYLPPAVQDCGTSMRLLRALKRAKSPDFGGVEIKQEMIETFLDSKAENTKAEARENGGTMVQLDSRLPALSDAMPRTPRSSAHNDEEQDSASRTSSELSSLGSEPLLTEPEDLPQDEQGDTQKAATPIFNAVSVVRHFPFGGPSTPREESISKKAEKDRLVASEPCVSSVAYATTILGMNDLSTRQIPYQNNKIQDELEEDAGDIEGEAGEDDGARAKLENRISSSASIVSSNDNKVPTDLIQQTISAACSPGKIDTVDTDDTQMVPTLKIDSASPIDTDTVQTDRQGQAICPQYLHPLSSSAFTSDQSGVLSKQEPDDDDLVDSLLEIYMPSPRTMHAGLPYVISENTTKSPDISISKTNSGLERSDSECSVLWSRSTALQADSANLKFRGKDCPIIPEFTVFNTHNTRHATVEKHTYSEHTIFTSSSSSFASPAATSTPFDPCPATPKKWKENELLTPDGFHLQMPLLQSMTLAGVFVGNYRSSTYATRQSHEPFMTVSDDDDDDDSEKFMNTEKFVSPLATVYTL